MRILRSKVKVACGALGLLLLAPLLLLFSGAEDRTSAVAGNSDLRPVNTTAGEESDSTTALPQPKADEFKPEEHPLDAAIKWAKGSLAKLDDVKDYTARMVRRERVDGKLGEHSYMEIKIRHEPFSVYLKFLSPDAVKGREVIYVAGDNDGKLLAHEAGLMSKVVGTVALKIDGFIAMRGERYTIDKIGIKFLIEELIANAERDKEIPAPVEVTYFKNAKVDGRLATCMQVTHPVRHEKHEFSKALIFVDNELDIPIRYEAYGWPETEGEEPPLLEEYTYQDLKLNVGLTDADFSIENPEYQFPARSF